MGRWVGGWMGRWVGRPVGRSVGVQCASKRVCVCRSTLEHPYYENNNRVNFAVPQTRRWQAIVSDKIRTSDVWSLLMRRLLSVHAGGRKSGCGFYQIFMLLIAALCGATREHRKRRNQSSNC